MPFAWDHGGRLRRRRSVHRAAHRAAARGRRAANKEKFKVNDKIEFKEFPKITTLRSWFKDVRRTVQASSNYSTNIWEWICKVTQKGTTFKELRHSEGLLAGAHLC